MPNTSNQLISSFSKATRLNLLALCHPVRLKAGTILHADINADAQVYFPSSGAISLRVKTLGKTALEIAMLGREGMAGLHQYLGGDTDLLEAQVFIGMEAQRCAVADLRTLVHSTPELEIAIRRYVVFTLEQFMGKAMCVQCHNVQSRLASWLLRASDLADGHPIFATQDEMAQLLGVRRVSVTVAAHHLQRAGFIAYRRGTITFLDHGGLKNSACSCYTKSRHAHEYPT